LIAWVAVSIGNNKLQEKLVTDQEVKEDEMKRVTFLTINPIATWQRTI
jgi:hypothetical protein